MKFPTTPSAPRLEPLVPAQRKFIDRNVETAHRLLRRALSDRPADPFTPHHLERAIAEWFRRNLCGELNVQRDRYANALAAAWGCYLQRTLGMEWCLIEEGGHLKIGLHHRDRRLTIFPFATVAEAFARRDYELLSSLTLRARMETAD
ncbi:hypothetical protein [Lewinella sp. IMCC34183]|uniref:hypothetical protein n=1 Tax=Lewinella sp. IMCC34183 TaxID=2248762 RepID=UPI000E25D32A|nr:hypothetical protein [Lewinella sp. IMCC34183]